MTKTIIRLLFIFFITHCAFAQTFNPTATKQLIHAAREKMQIPGMAVAIVLHDRVVWVGADGYADIENQVLASPKTVWRLGSISKPISATAVMQLVAENKVKLKEPIWTYIPWYPRKNNTITVEELLTHTSGIRHYHYAEGEKENILAFKSVQDGAKIYNVDKEPLQFKPDTKYLYSSYAYSLLAGIVESVTQKSFAAYLHDNLFLPAGMLTAGLDKTDEIIPHRAHFYRKVNNEIINAPYVDVSYKWAAGGIIASAEDLAHYAIAMDDNKLLPKSSMQYMYTPHHLVSGVSTGYGVGWHIELDSKKQRWVYHSGAATGGSTFILRNPEKGLAVIILCNLEHPGSLKDLADQIAKNLQ